jgi:hypothetical protein
MRRLESQIMKRLLKDLADTPFSIDRLFVWAIGIVMLTGMVGMVILALEGRTIPPQIQSATMICIGAFIARIERKIE